MVETMKTQEELRVEIERQARLLREGVESNVILALSRGVISLTLVMMLLEHGRGAYNKAVADFRLTELDPTWQMNQICLEKGSE